MVNLVLAPFGSGDFVKRVSMLFELERDAFNSYSPKSGS